MTDPKSTANARSATPAAPLSAAALNELIRLEASATPAPWEWTDADNGDTQQWPHVPQGSYLGETLINLGDTYEGSATDCALVAEARNALPSLLAELAHHRAESAAAPRQPEGQQMVVCHNGYPSMTHDGPHRQTPECVSPTPAPKSEPEGPQDLSEEGLAAIRSSVEIAKRTGCLSITLTADEALCLIGQAERHRAQPADAAPLDALRRALKLTLQDLEALAPGRAAGSIAAAQAALDAAPRDRPDAWKSPRMQLATEATLTRRLRELRDDLANNSGKPFNSIRAQGINLAIYEIKRAYRAERKRKAGRHE